MSANKESALPAPKRYEESSVVIAGGTSGVGLASAIQLAAAGVPRMCLLGRNAERGAAAVQAVRDRSPAARVEFLACDALDRAAVERALASVREKFGSVDVLINSTASTYGPELLFRIGMEDIAPTLQDLLLPPLYLSRAVLPIMREQRGGVIINLASDAAKVPTPGETVIGAAMAGIVMFSRTLALEGKRDGIRVNVLTPSLIADTPTAAHVQRGGFGAKLFAKAATQADLGVAEANDIAAMIVFLAGPAARRLTGQAISVNGGISVA